MKTVLQHVNTGLFFKDMDQWTSDPAEAAAFRDTLAALEFCRRNRLTGVAVLHWFEDGTPRRVTGFRGRKKTAETSSESSTLPAVACA